MVCARIVAAVWLASGWNVCPGCAGRAVYWRSFMDVGYDTLDPGLKCEKKPVIGINDKCRLLFQ